MSLRAEHDLHRRRSGRNLGVGLVLVLFVALVFGLSVVKIKNGAPAPHANDFNTHTRLPVDPNPPAPRLPKVAPGVPDAARALTPDAAAQPVGEQPAQVTP